MRSSNRNNNHLKSDADKTKKKYFCLLFVCIFGVIAVIFVLVHSTNRTPATLTPTELYPLKCTYNGSFTETQSIKALTNCTNKYAEYSVGKRNSYVVLYNYVTSSKRFNCEESVTYVTHADFTFLDNLGPLLEKWNGPISLAMHAPGTDFYKTVESIAYLRRCTSQVAELVTFHLFFLEDHAPNEIPHPSFIANMTYNCSTNPPFENVDRKDMYVSKHSLIYPINVGRNVARVSAETYYVFTSDIELYPSPNVIPQFLNLIAACDYKMLPYKPVVFVLHIFEIEKGYDVPTNKTDLIRLLKRGTVIRFHQNICSVCHTIPEFDEWAQANETSELQIFTLGKRTGKYYHWEPIYIGTNAEPLYDERLSWEGMKDKVVQGYELCLRNYTFFVLDNAFLVHKPGIKKSDPEKNKWRKRFVEYNDKLIEQVIIPSINKNYKNLNGCQL
ncbi:hypothetical protein PPYR_09380 [Photinus pyralis]|uniref:N-acetyllactosaminide beta-1,3-N-acetylglucosaminyltransferase n=1 Tax=Photinus pyralis TaxID=7054 RepID=A0A1Y1N3Q4_PHOPY|nr:hypothetical protein PPYR_09380 [Photinus pyralis]